MAGFGFSSSSSTPQDMTPEAFKNLQTPFALTLGKLLGFGSLAGTTAGAQGATTGTSTGLVAKGAAPQQYAAGTIPQAGGMQGSTAQGAQPTGPVIPPGFAAPTANPVPRPGANASPDQVKAYAQQQGLWAPGSFGAGLTVPGDDPLGVKTNPAPVMGATGPSWQDLLGMIGSGNANDILNGIPKYQGDLAAPIGANEQSLLDQLMKLQNTGNNGSDAFLKALFDGSAFSGVKDVTSGTITPQQIAAMLVNAGKTSAQQIDPSAGAINYGGDGSADPYAAMRFGDAQNPFLQAYTQAQQRTTMDQLTQALTRDLPGRFTQGGQFVQPQGSSAFDRAAALATRGAADAMGDIASNIGYNAYASDRALEAQSIDAQQNRILQALTGTAGNALQALLANQSSDLQSQTTNVQAALQAALANQSTDLAAKSANQQADLAAQTSNETNSLTAQQANQNAALEKVKQQAAGVPLQQQQVQSMIQNLTAQALPRLIQEQGIERGIDSFNNQVNALLQILGIVANVTQPTVANSSKSSGFNVGFK